MEFERSPNNTGHGNIDITNGIIKIQNSYHEEVDDIKMDKRPGKTKLDEIPDSRLYRSQTTTRTERKGDVVKTPAQTSVKSTSRRMTVKPT